VISVENLIGYAFTALWVIFFAYWMLSALRIKRARSSESRGSRFAYGIPIWFAAIMLLTRSSLWGPLQERIFPLGLGLALTGLALTALGIGFAIWARYTLGQNWSSKVTIKVDHELIRSGPYARVRHPIYSGLLLALIGTALAMDQWRGLVAVLLVLLGFYLKASTEEKMLAQEFGERFREHQRHTGFLLPWI
jgi:protein-S-isoprenylcysteine O-methyltransferase Ste14